MTGVVAKELVLATPEASIPWATWFADQLNQIFKEHGQIGQLAQIGPETIRRGTERLLTGADAKFTHGRTAKQPAALGTLAMLRQGRGAGAPAGRGIR